MRGWRWFALAAVAGSAVATGYYLYCLPWLVLDKIRPAAMSGDAELLRECIDFESLQVSMSDLFDGFSSSMLDSVVADNPYSSLIISASKSYGEELSKQLLTPGRLISYAQNHKGSTDTDAIGRYNLSGKLGPLYERIINARYELDSSDNGDRMHKEFRYASASRFNITIVSNTSKKDVIVLSMKRHGLTWKISSLSLALGQ